MFTFVRAIALGLALSLSAVGLASAQNEAQTEYQLGSGDKLRITFFGKHTTDLSGDYEIDGRGMI